jgi:hypothetical protein
MNGGSTRGGAYGFTFSSLGKIRDTKSPDNKTMLHYLTIAVEEEGNQHMSNWYDELPQITLATKGILSYIIILLLYYVLLLYYIIILYYNYILYYIILLYYYIILLYYIIIIYYYNYILLYYIIII